MVIVADRRRRGLRILWTFLVVLLCLVLGTALSLSLGGCAVGAAPTAEDVANAKQVLVAQREQAAAAKADAQAKGDTKAVEKADKTMATLDKLGAGLEAAMKPDGSIDPSKLGVAAGAILPPPWGWIIGLAGTSALALVSEARRRGTLTDFVSVINGFSSATAHVPGFKDALDKAEPVLKKEYSAGALKQVNLHKLKKAA